MTALFNIVGESAFLTEDELIELTGRSSPNFQIDWLKENSWKFEVSARKKPIVSRIYMMMRMSGINLEEKKRWQPNLNSF